MAWDFTSGMEMQTAPERRQKPMIEDKQFPTPEYSLRMSPVISVGCAGRGNTACDHRSAGVVVRQRGGKGNACAGDLSPCGVGEFERSGESDGGCATAAAGGYNCRL